MQGFHSVWFRIIGIGLLFIVVHKLMDHIGGIYPLLHTASAIFRPFFIGSLLAFLLYRPSRFLEEKLRSQKYPILKKCARGSGIFAVYLALFGFLFFTVKVIVPAVVKNMEQFIYEAPKYYHRAMEFLQQYSLFSTTDLAECFRKLSERLFSVEFLGKYMNALSAFAVSLASIFSGIVVSIYILWEREMLLCAGKRFIRLVTRGNYRQDQVIALILKIGNLFYSYFAGLGLDALLLGGVSVVCFFFLRVPYAFLFGVLVGICNLIPFFGPIAAALVIFVVSFFSMGPVKALWILLFQVILGQLDAHLIQPKIVGNAVGISPFWVIFSVLVFGQLWGVGGMILGVPLIAVLRVLFAEWEEKQYQKNKGVNA